MNAAKNQPSIPTLRLGQSDQAGHSRLWAVTVMESSFIEFLEPSSDSTGSISRNCQCACSVAPSVVIDTPKQTHFK